jgi:hypothetical protein
VTGYLNSCGSLIAKLFAEVATIVIPLLLENEIAFEVNDPVVP